MMIPDKKLPASVIEKFERDLKNVANIKDKNEKLSWTRRRRRLRQW